MKVFCVFLLKK